MARKGITESDVAEAIAALMNAGIKQPSIRMIHQKLGQGSLTTISRHKRTLEYELRASDSEIPDRVHSAIADAVQSIWDELSEAAYAAIATEVAKAAQGVEEHQEAEAAAQIVATEAEIKATALAQELDQIKAELSTASEKVSTLQDQLTSKTAENKELSGKAQELESVNTGLNRHVESLEAIQVQQTNSSEIDRKANVAALKRWEAQQATMQQSIDRLTLEIRTLEKTDSGQKQQIASLLASAGELKKDKDRTIKESQSL
jgi:chromosome segregation ATPase